MYIINRYILKKFLSSFFLAIGLIISIVIVFDISEKIDDFLYKKAPFHLIVFQYYFNFIPFFINMFSPLFTFISVIFFTSKMASNSEIIAILSSGISYRRMLIPFLYGALIIAGMTFFLSNYLIPFNNKARMNFEQKYMKKKRYGGDFHNIHIQLEKHIHGYAEMYSETTNTASNFTLEVFNDQNEIIKKMTARNLIYDSITSNWRLVSASFRTIDGMEETLTFCLDTTIALNLHPKDFNIRSEDPVTMNFFELNQFIDREKLRGSPLVKSYLIEKYQRLMNPIMVIIMTFIGVAVSSKKIRGGVGLNLALGITIAFTYVLFSRISTVFSIQGNMSPFMAVMLPSAIFGIVSFFLINRAAK